MPVHAPSQPLRAVALAEQARRSLLTAIIDGDLEPGEALRETTLGETLGISRTPVREALHRLAEIDLVRADSSRGYRVTPLEAERLRETVEVLAELSGMAARLALPRFSEDDVAHVAESARRILAVGPATGPSLYGSATIDLIAERCGNAVLRESLDRYRPHMLRLLRLNATAISPRVVAAHAEDLVAALRSADPDAFDVSVRAYYLAVGTELLRPLA